MSASMKRFYLYEQNNSYGTFQLPAAYVLISADTAEMANKMAVSLGLYFNGVEDGVDCQCCGDRWGECGDDDYVPADKISDFLNELQKDDYDKTICEQENIPLFCLVDDEGHRTYSAAGGN